MKHKVLLVATGLLVASAGITGGLVFGLKAYRSKIEAEKEKINNEAKKVNADYDNKDQTEASQVDPTKIKFSGIDLDMYDISIKSVAVSPTDSTKLLVTIIVTKKNDKSYNKEIIITIDGFKKEADNKEILNEKINSVVSVKYAKDTTDIFAKDAKSDEVIFEGVEQGYVPVIKNLFVKLDNQTILSVVFTLKEINRDLESDAKNLEIPGFKLPIQPVVAKTKDELDAIIKNLNNASYDGDKTSIRVSDIDKNKIKINEIPDGFGVIISTVTPKISEPTTAIIKFTLQENGGSIQSEEKELEIPGFSEPFLDKKQLDTAIDKVTDVTYNDGKNSDTEIKNIDKTKIKFVGLDDNLETNISDIKPKDTDNTVAIVTFTVNEKGKTDPSKPKVIEIPGFKKPSKTQAELDTEIMRISSVVYNDNKATTEVKNIDKNKIIFSDLGNEYESSIVSVNPKNGNSTIAVVRFKIKEKNGSIFSVEKNLEISGFKKQSLTKNELDALLKSTSTIKYLGDKSITEVKDINNNLLIFSEAKPSIQLKISKIAAKVDNKSTALITIKIGETNGSILSDEKTFEITGFKQPPKTIDELNKIIKSIVTLGYQDDVASLEVSQILRSKIIFNTLAKQYVAEVTDITTKNSNPTDIALIKFKIREVNGFVYSDEVTLELGGFKKASKTLIDLKTAIDKVTNISYKGKIAETEVSKIDKNLLVFQNLDSEYEPTVTEIQERYTDSTVALITFKIKAKNGSTFSGEKTITVFGFKKRLLNKNEIDAKIDRIVSATYLGNKDATEVSDIDNDKIVFDSLGTNFIAKILEIKEDQHDKTVARVSFNITEKNGNIVSKTKQISVFGFKWPALTLEELNDLIRTLNSAEYAGYTKNTMVKNIDKNLIKINGVDASKIQVLFTDVSPKPTSPSTAIIKLKIKEKTGSIISEEKTIELAGFKEPELSFNELNVVLSNITTATFLGDRSKTEVKNIDKNKIKFNNLTNNFAATIVSVLPKVGEPSIAIVKFKINEVGKTTFSSEKEIELNGFKKPPLTKDQLNAILNNINIVAFRKDKSQTLVKDIMNDDLTFFIKESNIIALIDSVKPKNGLETVAVVTFRIKENNEVILSDQKSIEVPGFKMPPKTTNDLNVILSKIQKADYNGDKSSVLVKNIDKKDIIFSNLPSGYVANIIEISEDSSTQSTAIIRFSISEKGGTVFSSQKLISIEGFKKPSLTKDKLDQILKGINTATYKGDKSQTLVEKIEEVKLSFNNVPTNISVVISSIKPKVIEKSIAEITINIKEKNGTVLSNSKTIELGGFKTPALTQAQLDYVLGQITKVTYNGNKSQTLVENIDKDDLIFDNLYSEIEVVVKSIKAKTNDKTVAEIVFVVKEKNEALTSVEKTLSLDGFKNPAKTLHEINAVLDKIQSAKYSGDKANTLVQSIEKNKIQFDNLPAEFLATIVDVNQHSSSEITAIVTFKISEKGGVIFSSEKQVYITGFKAPDKTSSQLNDILRGVTSATYKGDAKNTLIKDIDKNKIVFNNLDSKYKATITSVTPHIQNSNVAAIRFKISEVGKSVFSNEKTLFISGFKLENLTKDELNKIIETITFEGYQGDKTSTTVDAIQRSLLRFQIPNNKFDIEIRITSITPKNDDKSVAIIKFTINQKGFISTPSDEAFVLATGFKLPDKTTNELNEIIRKIKSASYSGNKATIPVAEADPRNIRFDGLDTSKYQAVISSFIANPANPTSGIVTFHIKEIGKRAESSSVRLEIAGFRRPFLTQAELDLEAKQIPEIHYSDRNIDLRPSTMVKDIQTKFISLIGIRSGLSFEITNVEKDKSNSSIALISYRLKEFHGKISSVVVTKPVSGFKGEYLSREEMARILNKINRVRYTGDVSRTEIRYIDKAKLVFDNVDNSVHVIIKSIEAKNHYDTAVIEFYLVDKNNNNNTSGTKKLEISGFYNDGPLDSNLNKLFRYIRLDYRGKNRIYIDTHDDAKKLSINQIVVSGIDYSKYEFVPTKIYAYKRGKIKVEGYIQDRKVGTRSRMGVIKIRGFATSRHHDDDDDDDDDDD